jgi:hypothetical protein
MQCPVCCQLTVIKAQAHVGASFENDGSGRFCHATYRIGEQLRWWRPDRQGYQLWKTAGHELHGEPGIVRECSYAACAANDDKLYAIIEFSELHIHRLVEIGAEADWPEGDLK